MSITKTERADIENRFTYHAPRGEAEISEYETIRGLAKGLSHHIVFQCEDSRERSLAITKLQECVMWANASIALHGFREHENE